MALTESNMLPLGSIAPSFELENVLTKRKETLKSLQGKEGTLIIFMCNHCPYVIHLLEAVIEKAKKWSKQGINSVGISSNSISTHPQDGPIEMAKLARNKNFGFPYLFDPTQEIAHAYEAACTPDFYLFDNNLKLHYRGRFDASRPGNDQPVDGVDLQKAVDALLTMQHPLEDQWPSMGCNIKWIPGNEPQELNNN
jgi:peroxiredoxin